MQIAGAQPLRIDKNEKIINPKVKVLIAHLSNKALYDTYCSFFNNEKLLMKIKHEIQ